jgi:hypothetical protein
MHVNNCKEPALKWKAWNDLVEKDKPQKGMQSEWMKEK